MLTTAAHTTHLMNHLESDLTFAAEIEHIDNWSIQGDTWRSSPYEKKVVFVLLGATPCQVLERYIGLGKSFSV